MLGAHLDRFNSISSPVHRLPPAVKLVAAIALVIFVTVLPARYWPGLVAAAIGVILVAWLSRIPFTFILKRLLLLQPFVIGVAVLAIFQEGGWWIAILLVGKCTLCLLTMILLAATTPFSDMLRVLQALHVPSLMVTTLALMYRYLFVLMEESRRMKRARMSRTFTPGRSWHWRSMATVISQLFVRASERAERIYAAMCARGWQ